MEKELIFSCSTGNTLEGFTPSENATLAGMVMSTASVPSRASWVPTPSLCTELRVATCVAGGQYGHY